MFFKLDTIHLFVLLLFLIPVSWLFIDVGQNHLTVMTINSYGPIRSEVNNNYWQMRCDEIYPESCPANFQLKLPRWTSKINSFRTNNSFVFNNILVVIHFSSNRYDSAAKVVALYNEVFPNLALCGPDEVAQFWPSSPLMNSTDPFKLPKDLKYFGYGLPEIHPGENIYWCLNKVLEHFKANDYKGVLMAADDVILNYWTWNYWNLSLDNSWLIDEATSRQIYQVETGYFCNSSSHCSPSVWTQWMWYEKYRNQTINFVDDFEQQLDFEEVKHRLQNITLGKRRMLRGYADIFYITQQNLPCVTRMFELMNRHRVWLETAVPTAIQSCVDSNNLIFLDRKSNDYGYGRVRLNEMADAYDPNYQYLHPFKMSLVFAYENKEEGEGGASQPVQWQVALMHGKQKQQQQQLQSVNKDFYRKDDKSITCVFCFILNISSQPIV